MGYVVTSGRDVPYYVLICHLTAALSGHPAYCAEQGIERHVFKHEETSPGQFTMSVIVGKEKLSLNTLFPNLHAGREGISRKALSRVKDRAQKQSN
ncbi:hypothetical protein CPB86DRAFT_306378 [Serendipita vermifera]|nr:hypothetical protein CPB86DRAFT_306378 [Serendipita vermifera]